MSIESETELNNSADIININDKINTLNTKLDNAKCLAEPQDNYYLQFSPNTDTDINGNMTRLLASVGSVRTCGAVASRSSVTMSSSPVLHLSTLAVINTVDMAGDNIDCWDCHEDVINVDVCDENKEKIKYKIEQLNNGTISVKFTPMKQCDHSITVTMFGRTIGQCPLECQVSPHNSPVANFGSKGIGDCQFVQPCSITIGKI